MTATTAPRVTRTPTPAAKAPRPVAVLDDILLELVDVGSNIRVDAGELAELAASIVTVGLQSPIKVTRQSDGRYRLVYGQRRVLASRQAGLTRILALVEPPSDVDEAGARRSIEQLVENLQRADLNPIDEAVALRAVLDADPGLTQEALADQLGRSRPWVSKALGLLEAAPRVQELVRAGQLTPSHVTALRGLAPKNQVELAKEAVARGRSAHGLEEAVQDHKRSEEFRKEREARDRKSQEAQAAAWTNAGEKKLGKEPRHVRIQVHSYYGTSSDRVQGLVRFLTKAGFTNVTHGNVASRSQALGCDCLGWNVDSDYGNLTIVPGCFDTKHQQAKTKANDDKRSAKDELANRVQQQVRKDAKGWPVAEVVGEPAIAVPRILAEAAVFSLLNYRLPEWSVGHGGKRTNPWATIHGLADDTLALELAMAIASDFRDHAGYHVDWSGLATELGVLEASANAQPGKAVIAEQEPITDFRSDVEAS